MPRQLFEMVSFLVLLLCSPTLVEGFGVPELATLSPTALGLDSLVSSVAASAADPSATTTWIADATAASNSLVDSASSSSSVLTNLVQGYQHALATQALKTQMLTGVFLAILGDGLAQNTISKEPNGYNVKRAVSFATFDAVYRAAQHYIYPPMIALCQGHALGQLLPAGNAALAAAIEQALASQIIIIPIVYYPVFFAVTGAVQGLTPQQTIERAKESFWPLMKRNWLFWIPVQFGVFAGVHDEAAQIVILIACGLVWTIILSILAGQVQQEPEPVLAVEMASDSNPSMLLSSRDVSLGDASSARDDKVNVPRQEKETAQRR